MSIASTDTPSAASGKAAWPRPFYAWYVVGMLVLAFTFAVLDRSIISLLVDPIKADLHITDAQVGLLQGLAFAICYTSFGLVLGFMTDRLNRRYVLSAGIAFWSLATVLCGFADSFATLFAARIAVGLGEAAIMPASASLIADYFPVEKRGRAYGIFLFGGSLGVGFGNLMGGIATEVSDGIRGLAPTWLGDLHMWQTTFIAVGVPGLFVALAFVLTVREPDRREKVDHSGGYSLAPLWRHMRKNLKAYVTFMGGAVLNVTAINANTAWLATIFIRVHGWTPAQVGANLFLMSLVGMTSSISVGFALAALTKRGRRDAPVFTTLAQSCSQLVFGPMICLAPTPYMALGFYVVMLLTTNWTTSSAMTGLSQITPNELRGQMVAFYTLLTGLISLTIGTYSVGFLSDHVYEGAKAIGPSLGTVLALSGVTAIITLTTGRLAFKKAAEEAEAWQERAS